MVNFQSMERYSFQDLNRIMALLRQPGGCPWDREQTHESIRRNMLEEAYEAVEAIDEKDPGHLKEELGDVLLQVVFHARMAEEEGLFTLDDVVDGICKKLVYRHPHVFGTVDARDSGQALNTWDAQKREEKVQDKARKAGFDWAEMGPALDKAEEELGELRQAVEQGANVEEELGDLLFAAVKVGRFAGLDSEQALHGTCEKFIRRFRRVEELAGGRPLDSLGLHRLEELWQQAKQDEA